jgi:hypothetical protein
MGHSERGKVRILIEDSGPNTTVANHTKTTLHVTNHGKTNVDCNTTNNFIPNPIKTVSVTTGK